MKMLGVRSITQGLPLTLCLVSQEWRHQSVSVLLFWNTFKQLYLKDERVNIILSIKNEHCFIYILVLNINTIFLDAFFVEKKSAILEKRPKYHNLTIHKY